MQFNTHPLTGILSEYIESIFHFKNFMPDHSIERVVPTGHIFIIFELDNIPRNTFNNNTLEPINTYTKVWVSGIHKNYISISAHQNSEMFVIQFKPYGAYPFFNIPIAELNDKVIPAENLFGQSIFELRDEIIKNKKSEGKFDAASTWLTCKIQQGKFPPNEFIQLVKQIQQNPSSKFNETIKKYANTQKHLIEQFKSFVGLTPKYYQRILRINEILSQIQHSKEIDWAQISYQGEYSDQSHFIKEFKHFSGINPQKFIKQNFHNEEANFFPLDR